MHKILIIDRQPIFALGLEQVLTATQRFDVMAFHSKEAGLAAITEFRPDIVLIDHEIDKHGGLQVLQPLRDLGGIPALFYAAAIDPDATIIAIRLGVRGIILKDAAPQMAVHAVTAILSGGTYFDPRVTEAALSFSLDNPAAKILGAAQLSDREQVIADYVALGMRNREIADRCGVAEGTVKAHLHSIFSKMGVSSRTQLIVSMKTKQALQQ